MPNISVVILVRNEAENIAECLRSCAELADEVILVDDASTDGTVEAARAERPDVRVFFRKLDGWGAQKTFGIEQATGDWVFLLDADERVTPELSDALRKAVSGGERKAWWVTRRTHCRSLDATHGVLRPDRVLRLLPREGARVVGEVHEEVVSPFPQEHLRGGELIHYSYRDWDAYWRKFGKYTALAAEKAHREGKRCVFWRDVVLRPIWAFLKVYVVNGGFLDGRAGWIFSCNHACYTMTKYVRLWYLERFDGRI